MMQFSVLSRASEMKLIKKMNNAEVKEMALLHDDIVRGLNSACLYHERELQLAAKYGFKVKVA
jgi:hypothetical protein